MPSSASVRFGNCKVGVDYWNGTRIVDHTNIGPTLLYGFLGYDVNNQIPKTFTDSLSWCLGIIEVG